MPVHNCAHKFKVDLDSLIWPSLSTSSFGYPHKFTDSNHGIHQVQILVPLCCRLGNNFCWSRSNHCNYCFRNDRHSRSGFRSSSWSCHGLIAWRAGVGSDALPSWRSGSHLELSGWFLPEFQLARRTWWTVGSGKRTNVCVWANCQKAIQDLFG